MGLITKEVEVGLSSINLRHYEELKYEIPKSIGSKGRLIVPRGTKIRVKVEDLTNSSAVFVDCECDGCGKELNGITWYNYNRSVIDNNKYYCQKCAMNGHKKWVSFFEWCYLNLSKKLADYILSRWDEELNVDKDGNKISPKDIPYGSAGLNKKGYWFKCLDHPEHLSEKKSINGFTNGKKGSITCKQCKTLSITHPHLIYFLKNKEDAYKYSMGEHKNIMIKCPRCGCEKEMMIYNFIQDGFTCPQCSDGVPYTEKFMFNLLKQLIKIVFINQLTKKVLKWCNNYRYDFYIEKLKGIICECHGSQHYEEHKGNWQSLSEIQDNDFDKEWLARENGIDNYIILDCRKSELEWIKNSIMNSKLPKLLNFKEEDIDWEQCHEYACNSLVKEVCDLWGNNLQNTLKIAEELKICRTTVTKYLKQGAELGWCDYDAEEESKKSHFKKMKK